MPESSDLPPVETLTFEQALTELEAIVRTLEEDERPLDEALRLFNRGQALLAHCTRLLDQAELQVRQVVGEELQPWSDTLQEEA